LPYTEDMSKNRPEGLKGRNIKPKAVVQDANLEASKWCFVRKLYMFLCPDNAPAHALYLRPANHPTANCWYSKQPLGHTTLSKTVAWLCTSAGIQGHKTNHSLRAGDGANCPLYLRGCVFLQDIKHSEKPFWTHPK